jgi:hypothetical protein
MNILLAVDVDQTIGNLSGSINHIFKSYYKLILIFLFPWDWNPPFEG